MYSSQILLTALVLALVPEISGGAALAQVVPAEIAGRNETTVVVLAVSDFGSRIRSRIVIRSEATPEAVIIVPAASANEVDLAEAFHVLHQLRKEVKQKSFKPGTIIRQEIGGIRRNRKLSGPEQAAYSTYLAALSNGPEIDVPGVGRGRAVQVFLPKWP